MRIPPLWPVVTASALTLGLVGCNGGATTPVGAAQDRPSPQASLASPSAAPSTLAPSPTPSPVVAPPTRPALPAYDVALVERQLTAQRYYIGGIDGVPGESLRSAVMAFQKVNGLPVDGDVGPITVAALKTPKPFVPQGTTPADRVEVDLTRQVLAIIKSGKVTRILPVSSGNGATYLQKNGQEAVALTPVGYYAIERRIYGPEVAELGTLYDPQYFYDGWAIHGSDSVPATPASHGCIRIPRPDATWLLDQIGVGTAVYIYGGSYTFTAGSSAPGTRTPGGDPSAGTTAPAPRATTAPPPAPTNPPSPKAKPSPSATASSSPAPAPAPSST